MSEARVAAPSGDFVMPRVSPTCYKNVWYFALGIRFLCCKFLSLTTLAYFYMAQPQMSYYAAMIGLSDGGKGFKLVGYAFGVLAAAHTFDLASMLWFSAWNRELLYKPRRNGEAHGTFLWITSLWWRENHNKVEPHDSFQDHCCLHKKQTSICENPEACSVLKSVSTALQRTWLKVFGRHGFLGVESEHFEAQFAIREVVEIVAQSVQAYSSSMLVASPGINTLYVGILVLNCWSSPIITHMCKKAELRFRKRRRNHGISRLSSTAGLGDSSAADLQRSLLFERVWCLSIELCLDAGAAMLIPTIIFVPYAQMFDFQASDFLDEYIYDDVWAVKMVMAAQQFFVLTQYDFVFMLAPHIGIYIGLGSLISLTDTREIASKKKPMLPSICVRYALLKANSQRKDNGSRHSSGPSRSILSRQLTRIGTGRRIVNVRIDAIAKTLLHFLFAFWGATILFLHIGSFITYAVEYEGCSQRVWPWITQKLPCSVFEYNCYYHNTSTVPEDAFQDLESRVLSALLFTHCPALVVPASITSFSNLMGLGIFNSTISAWPVEAAITEARHPNMKYMSFVRTNMTRFPDGLLEHLPQGLVDFEVAVSNLSVIPDELVANWGHSLSIVYLERCAFTEFPSPLMNLGVQEISLFGNPISSMAAVKLGLRFDMLTTLVLANMPLHDFPTAAPESSPRLEWVSVENTETRELPSWVFAEAAARRTTTIFASGTPFCDFQLPPETPAAKFRPGLVITCVKQSNFANGKIPLDLVTRMRALETVKRIA